MSRNACPLRVRSGSRLTLHPCPPGPPSFRAQVSVSLGLLALLHLYSRVRLRLSSYNKLILLINSAANLLAPGLHSPETILT